jgi:hypothetical protein
VYACAIPYKFTLITCFFLAEFLYFLLLPQVSLISCPNLIIIAVYILTFACDIALFRGYIEAIWEIEQQLQTGTGQRKFDDVVVACGRFHSIPSSSPTSL